MAATMDDMRALLTAQMSKDPNQTLHRVRALAFGDAVPTTAPASTPDPVVPEKKEKKFFRKETTD